MSWGEISVLSFHSDSFQFLNGKMSWHHAGFYIITIAKDVDTPDTDDTDIL